MAVFCKGDEVEVCSKQEGFYGSYYEATVISQLKDGSYKVEYKNLVEEEDHSRPLVEIVAADEVRPMPPKISREATPHYSHLQRVDAFDNDGWWLGDITRKGRGKSYWVYFPTTGDEIEYPVSQLRNHQEWYNGRWYRARSMFD